MRAWVSARGELYYAKYPRVRTDPMAPPRPTAEHEWVARQGWVLPADVDDQRAGQALDRRNRLELEVLLRHENRIRALEGKGEITRAQFRAALIALWKELNS